MNRSTHQDFITFLWAQEQTFKLIPAMKKLEICEHGIIKKVCAVCNPMSEPIEISRLAYLAGHAETEETEKPIGYYVQQLLNAETEKLRKENEELKAKILILEHPAHET